MIMRYYFSSVNVALSSRISATCWRLDCETGYLNYALRPRELILTNFACYEHAMYSQGNGVCTKP